MTGTGCTIPETARVRALSGEFVGTFLRLMAKLGPCLPEECGWRVGEGTNFGAVALAGMLMPRDTGRGRFSVSTSDRRFFGERGIS